MTEAFTKPSTLAERLLLFTGILILPFQDLSSGIEGVSFTWAFFLLVGLYVVLHRLNEFIRIVFYPLFLGLFCFMGFAFLMESLHLFRTYSEINQILQMVLGGALVASLCRDDKAMNTMIWAYVLNGVWISIFLISTGYSILTGAIARNPEKASEIRYFALSSVTWANWNVLGFFMVQAMAGVLTLFFTIKKSALWQILLSSFVILLVLGVLVTMSRGASLALLVVSLVVSFSYGVFRLKTLVMVAIAGVTILTLAPSVIFERITASNAAEGTKKLQEGRMVIYKIAGETWPEYILTGVGTGNFWKDWGREKGFAINALAGKGVIGGHNAFLQSTFYWGFASLIFLFGTVWQIFRFLRSRDPNERNTVFLKGVGTALFILLCVSTSLFSKTYSFYLGMIAALWMRAQISSQPSSTSINAE